MTRTVSGGALLMTLVVVGIFIVMMLSSAAYINRQFHETVKQEQAQVAFFAADAGIQYVSFLLSSGTYTVGELMTVGEITETVYRPGTETAIGTFRLEFTSADENAQRIDFDSTGQDLSIPVCQRISAAISGQDLVDWDHQLSCDVVS